uniref:Uncharacterized protein n=1 Tax=Arundo donax TaxID=35708 RepID=A0A0A9S1G9_ARUDO
MPAPPLACL